MKLFIVFAGFILSCVILPIQGVQHNNAIEQLASFQKATGYFVRYNDRPYKVRNLGVTFDFLKLVQDPNISSEQLSYVLGRSEQISDISQRTYVKNGATYVEKFVKFFDQKTNIAEEYVYHTRCIARPFSVKRAALLVSGAVGALAGAYYYREQLKPLVQDVWKAHIMPRVSALYTYLARK